MKIRVSELRRLVYEAVAEARGKRGKRARGRDEPVDGPRGPDGYLADPALDLSRPPPKGGQLKRMGTTPSSPAFTGESRARRIIHMAVREALRR